MSPTTRFLLFGAPLILVVAGLVVWWMLRRDARLARERARRLAAERGPSAIFLQMRELLYCEIQPETLAPADLSDEHVEKLRRIVSDPKAETRAILAAWRGLRLKEVSPPPELRDAVMGVVVEEAYEASSYVIGGFADGTARLFVSSGGGIIGQTMPAPIAAAAKALVAQAASVALPRAARSGLPPKEGFVRLVLLTPGGMFAFEAQRATFDAPAHPLHGLYQAAQDLLTQCRLYYEGRLP